MPQSNFYWEMSGEAVKHKEKRESTYSIHSTVQQEGVGGWKHKFPSLHLTHLFICLYPLPSLSHSCPRLSFCLSASQASLYNCSECVETGIHWQRSRLRHSRHSTSTRQNLWPVTKKHQHTRHCRENTMGSIVCSITWLYNFNKLMFVKGKLWGGFSKNQEKKD